VAEFPLSLDVGRVVVSAGQGAATARRVARWTVARSGGDGWVARATQRGEKAVDGRGGRHDRAHRNAPCAPGAARDVHVEGAAQEGGPIHAGKRRVELASLDDLRGARAGWVDPWSATGFVVPRIELARRGIVPTSYALHERRAYPTSTFRSEKFHGTHQETLRALARGDFDVAGTFAQAATGRATRPSKAAGAGWRMSACACSRRSARSRPT